MLPQLKKGIRLQDVNVFEFKIYTDGLSHLFRWILHARWWYSCQLIKLPMGPPPAC